MWGPCALITSPLIAGILSNFHGSRGMQSNGAWAREVFGTAKLGDARVVSRTVRVAEAAAERPSGRVTAVCRSAAEREGAYRLLERARFDVAQLTSAVTSHGAVGCQGHARVLVPVDQTGLSVADRQQRKDIGRILHANSNRQGLQVMSALAMTPDGVPLGLLAQQWHRRPDAKSPDEKHDPRPPEQRESALWRRALTASVAQLATHSPTTRPWFLLDRGGDARQVLRWANEHRGTADVTLRNAYNRRLIGGGHLRPRVLRQKVAGHVHVHVRASRGRGRNRPARIARCTVRHKVVQLNISSHCDGVEPVEVSVVHVREQRARRSKPIEWWLLSTCQVSSFQDAVEVINAYTRRWRIEELHYTWKSGACDIESSQLRSQKPLQIWATILAAVAVRIERLKHLSRNHPDLPASEELSQDEVDAAIALSRTAKHSIGDSLSILDAVLLIAQVGGYAAKPSKSPPGSKVLSRGFDRVLAAAEAIRVVRSSG